MKDEKQLYSGNSSDINGIVCNAFFQFNDISNFDNLEFIQITSVGYDRIPVEYIKERNIKIFNAENVYSIPISEWVLLKILEIYKKSKLFYESQRQHRWEKQRNILELTGKNALIIGFGSIGQEIAKRIKPFGVKTIAIDIESKQSEFINEYHNFNSIKDILNKGDIIIISVPLTEETKGMINSDMIGYMKNQSILVNVSRGAVINQNEMIQEIKNGKFLGVALDVFEEEPLSADSELWSLDNVIITPHNSFQSEKNGQRLFDVIYKNLKAFVEDR